MAEGAPAGEFRFSRCRKARALDRPSVLFGRAVPHRCESRRRRLQTGPACSTAGQTHMALWVLCMSGRQDGKTRRATCRRGYEEELHCPEQQHPRLRVPSLDGLVVPQQDRYTLHGDQSRLGDDDGDVFRSRNVVQERQGGEVWRRLQRRRRCGGGGGGGGCGGFAASGGGGGGSGSSGGERRRSR